MVRFIRRSAHGKSGSRRLFLSAEAVRELVQVRPSGVTPETPVLSCTCSTFGSHFEPHSLRMACEAAGLTCFTLYGLRRAAVNRWRAGRLAGPLSKE